MAKEFEKAKERNVPRVRVRLPDGRPLTKVLPASRELLAYPELNTNGDLCLAYNSLLGWARPFAFGRHRLHGIRTRCPPRHHQRFLLPDRQRKSARRFLTLMEKLIGQPPFVRTFAPLLRGRARARGVSSERCRFNPVPRGGLLGGCDSRMPGDPASSGHSALCGCPGDGGQRSFAGLTRIMKMRASDIKRARRPASPARHAPRTWSIASDHEACTRRHHGGRCRSGAFASRVRNALPKQPGQLDREERHR